MSLLATIFLDLWASYASWESISEQGTTASVAAHQKKTKNDTPYEQPPPEVKGHSHTVLGCWAVIEDLVGPLFGGQHSDCSENIQDVDEEVLEYDDVEPHVPGGEREVRILHQGTNSGRY